MAETGAKFVRKYCARRMLSNSMRCLKSFWKPWMREHAIVKNCVQHRLIPDSNSSDERRALALPPYRRIRRTSIKASCKPSHLSSRNPLSQAARRPPGDHRALRRYPRISPPRSIQPDRTTPAIPQQKRSRNATLVPVSCPTSPCRQIPSRDSPSTRSHPHLCRTRSSRPPSSRGEMFPRGCSASSPIPELPRRPVLPRHTRPHRSSAHKKFHAPPSPSCLRLRCSFRARSNQHPLQSNCALHTEPSRE